jgi:hypothetical protein
VQVREPRLACSVSQMAATGPRSERFLAKFESVFANVGSPVALHSTKIRRYLLFN